MNPSPIFIVGAPRSGTSLLRQMLNRHPGIAICDETHFFRFLYQKRRRKAFGDLGDLENRRRLVTEYVSLRFTQQLGLDREKLTERLLAEGVSYPAMFSAVMKCFAESHGKQRCGEKTPNHALVAETLCDWYPNAAVLHLVRDPRDVVASLLRIPFGWSSAVVNARTWLGLNRAARRSSHRPGYLEVRYETLVTQPEEELARICRFIGEEFIPCMLRPEQTSPMHPGEQDRYHAPVTTSRLGAWRSELTQPQAAQVEWVVGPYLEAFGYTREAPRASLATILGGVSLAAVAVTGRTLGRMPAHCYYWLAPKKLAKFEYWARRKTLTSEQGSKTRSR
ncbi:MAG TPA: sulfotransferase [Bryobacteraceae bacterium]|nr:sulfotransferase [Bryobacteraceae bacterium]